MNKDTDPVSQQRRLTSLFNRLERQAKRAYPKCDLIEVYGDMANWFEKTGVDCALDRILDHRLTKKLVKKQFLDLAEKSEKRIIKRYEDWKKKELRRFTKQHVKEALFEYAYFYKIMCPDDPKFLNSLAADLDAVRRDKSLKKRFKNIYPVKFHKYLKEL